MNKEATTTENSKVVIDPSASGALLALAYDEGLLIESDDNDHCLKHLASQDYPSWLTTQALEQVVLFDQLHLMSRLPWRGIHGDLIESGPFFSVDEPAKPEGEIQRIDPAILNGVLKARGISPTPFEDPSILKGVERGLSELEEWEHKYGEEPPSQISVFTRKALDRQHRLESRYVELEQIREPLDAFQPIVKALEEYLEVVAAAQARDAFIMTPIYGAASQELFRPTLVEQVPNEPTVLLRLTSSRLGVLPYGQTLSQTLKLARDPATVALRAKIQEWTESLTADSGADTERIQKEITKALKMLQRFGVGSQISNITTYLALPVGLAAMVSGFAAAMGWMCTGAGTIGLAASHATTKKYKWASFGSSNKK